MRNIPDDDPVGRAIKARLLDMIRRFIESEDFKQTVGNAISRSGIEPSKLETDLQMLIAGSPAEHNREETDTKTEPDLNMADIDKLDELFSHIPQRTVEERSFLSHAPSHLFEPLKDAFLTSCRYKNGIEQFEKLPIWQGAFDATEPLFVSFLVRIAFGPFPSAARQSALKMITHAFSSEETKIDGQALLPYATAMLADPDRLVRKETANLLIALRDLASNELVEGKSARQWGASDLYSSGSQSDNLVWLSPQEISEIINLVYLPVLEECVLDPNQISRVLESALKGSSSTIRVSTKTDKIKLKKSLRQSLFELLLSHLRATSLYALKSRLLTVIKNVDKVGSTSRTEHLLPVMKRWASLSAEDAQKSAQAAQVELSDLETTITAGIPPTDKDCIQSLLSLATDKQTQARPTFLSSVFDYMIKIWPMLSTERHVTATQTLFDRTIKSPRGRSCGLFSAR